MLKGRFQRRGNRSDGAQDRIARSEGTSGRVPLFRLKQARQPRHDGYTCTIVGRIRGHPPQTRLHAAHGREGEDRVDLGQREREREIRNKGRQAGTLLVRARDSAGSCIIVAIITPPSSPSSPLYLPWRTVRRTGFRLPLSPHLETFLLETPLLLLHLPCHLFLVTRRWKLSSPSRDVLRLLIRGTLARSQASRREESRVSAIRCNNFNTSLRFTPLFWKFIEISFEIRSRLYVPRLSSSRIANRSTRVEN